VCPEEALIYKAGQPPRIDRQRCSGCGECVSVCYYKALVLYGRKMDVAEVFDAVKRDAIFYQASGGGVTVSGGEVLLQSEFVCELLEKCRAAGIHTCIETSGFGAESALRQILRYTDLVLFDLKHMDSEKHMRYTGQPNSLILSNARVLAKSGVEFLFRMPLILGINDDVQNIRKTAEFLTDLGEKARGIEIMPYHRLGKGKYESLEIPYRLTEIPVPESDCLEVVQNMFEESGISCTISK
jgi:pyruvate formate lyase activating enzyme